MVRIKKSHPTIKIKYPAIRFTVFIMLKNKHSDKNSQISRLFYTKRKIHRPLTDRKHDICPLDHRHNIRDMSHRNIETYRIIILIDHFTNQLILCTTQTFVLGILGKPTHVQSRQRSQTTGQFQVIKHAFYFVRRLGYIFYKQKHALMIEYSSNSTNNIIYCLQTYTK